MKKRFESIQVLRAVAAILVALFHAQNQAAIYCDKLGLPPAYLNIIPSIRGFGAYGVDIFFVISGFIMAYVTRNKRGSFSYTSVFLKKRFIRIVPIYWIWTTLFVVLLLAAPGLFRNSVFELRGTVMSYLFLPYTPAGSYNSPVLPVGWTLWFEMYFYILVAVGLVFRERTFFILLGLFFAFSIFIGPHIPIQGRGIWMMTSPQLLEFWSGFGLGVFFASGIRLPAWSASAVLVGCAAAYGLWMVQGNIHLGIPSFLLVAGFVLLEMRRERRYPRFLVAIGDSSYSLYLTNFFVGPAVTKALMLSGFAGLVPPDLYIIFTTLLCIAFGHISYLLLEAPITSFLTRRFFSPVPATPNCIAGKKRPAR